jgi:hypothetical protein
MRLIVDESEVSLILLCEMKTEDRVETVEDSPQVSEIFDARPFWRQFSKMPPKDPNHVCNLKVCSTHRSSRIIPPDHPGYHRIEHRIFRFVVRQDLTYQKAMNFLHFSLRSLSGQDIQAIRDEPNPSDVRPELAVLLLISCAETGRDGSSSLRPLVPKGAQRIDNHYHVDNFLEDGSRDWRQ